MPKCYMRVFPYDAGSSIGNEHWIDHDLPMDLAWELSQLISGLCDRGDRFELYRCPTDEELRLLENFCSEHEIDWMPPSIRTDEQFQQGR